MYRVHDASGDEGRGACSVLEELSTVWSAGVA